MSRARRSNDWGFPRWRGYGGAREAAQVRLCDRAGCNEPGDCPAPKSPNKPERWYFCQKHAAEYNAGWDYFAGLDAEVLRKLRRGEFAVQGHIDLHGMTREEAKAAVDGFLRKARSAGKRCVLLVHGRGIHSKDQVPILKDALKHWLATARFYVTWAPS